MRTPLFAFALALAACSAADEQSATPASTASLGPDAIVLRVPMQGGAARAYRYPALDSLLWSTKAALPAQIRPMGFSIDAGALAIADSAGVPWRLTLGSGAVERALATPLGELTSLDGSVFFGTSNGAVLRLTPTEALPWQVRSAAALRQLQPLRDGGVLLVGQRDNATVLTRFRPPSTSPVDSAIFPPDTRLISAAGGDRYYLSDGPRRLISVRARDLEQLGNIAIGDSILATASSPSGDRVYVLGRDGEKTRLQVINKYGDEVVAKLEMPVSASALRMDPLGRYVLVRHSTAADSVLVIGIATDKVLGRFVSPWRADLPLVFPDGQVATLRGDDVVILSAGQFTPTAVIPGGARDVWTVVQWNGFRRRAGDSPARASALRGDSAVKQRPDSLAVAARARDTSVRDSNAPSVDTTPRRLSRADSARRLVRADSIRRALQSDSLRKPGIRADTQSRVTAAKSTGNPVDAAVPLGERGSFVVQFAALKAEKPAQQMASSIKANGARARVVVTTTNGIALYRVILGPFRSHADAERAGVASGRDYWVFEGGTN